MKPGARIGVAVLAAIAVATVAAGCWTGSPGCGSAADGPRGAQGALPAPTGPLRIGTAFLHLVDPGRLEDLSPGDPADHREIVAQAWYPAAPARPSDRPLYMDPLAAAEFARAILERSGVDVAGFQREVAAHATANAPVAPGAWPVVLFSPGWDGVCQAYTALQEDLASHGWVVVGVNHPYFASVVVLPDGRVIRHLDLPPGDPTAFFESHLGTLVADLRLLLDSLASANRQDPRQAWQASADLSRVAVVGHSLGGAVAAELAREDPRVCAAVDLDGTLLGDAARAGVGKPVLWLLHDGGAPELLGSLPAWQAAVPGSLAAEVRGSGHRSSEDLPTLLAPLLPPRVPPEIGWGTSDPRRTLDTIRAAVRVFLDVRLRGGDGTTLRRLPALCPDLRFIASATLH